MYHNEPATSDTSELILPRWYYLVSLRTRRLEVIREMTRDRPRSYPLTTSHCASSFYAFIRHKHNTSILRIRPQTSPLTSAMVVELPQEIVDKIVDEIALEGSRETRDQTRDMKSFSLVSSKWSRRSRSHLFRSLEITSNSFLAWCSDVRPGNDGPSRHITSIRYKPWCSEAERSTGPSESLARSPSHMSAFTCLRTLHFVEISLQHPGYLACFGVLTKVVRELWLEDCQMDITQFVSLVRPFTNLDWLRLIRPRCASESKLQHWDMAEPPILKGAFDFHQPANAENIASFTQELSLLPAYFSTIAFREHLETPTEANRLLAGSRRTLTKLTLSHNSEFFFRHSKG